MGSLTSDEQVFEASLGLRLKSRVLSIAHVPNTMTKSTSESEKAAPNRPGGCG